jgi:AcrR family transcriptional regulator
VTVEERRRVKRLPREVRERQILDAAVLVFSEQGYHSASMDEISDVAGVSKPMIYAYLGSKEDLFAACIHREANRLLEAIASGVRTELRPDMQLPSSSTSVSTGRAGGSSTASRSRRAGRSPRSS